jgi:hypothetical protein
MTDIEVVQRALEKAQENGWSALKSQYLRCYKGCINKTLRLAIITA